MFGAFFMLNLALAVIWSEYAKAGQGIKDKKKVRNQRTHARRGRGVSTLARCALMSDAVRLHRSCALGRGTCSFSWRARHRQSMADDFVLTPWA